MYRPKSLGLIAAGALLLSFSIIAAAQKSSFSRPVLWEKVDVRAMDTYLGPGGTAMQPDLSNITFIREEKGGYSKKYRIKDGAGRVWVAKVSNEAQSETAAVRLLWALGYKTEINYLVPSLTIPGKGTFTNVRLEARPANVDRGKAWRWGGTPFEKTHEMKGLMLMMAFINNWDMKSTNNVLIKDSGETQYVISDLGVSFGKTGSNGWPLFWRIGRSRNNPGDFAKAKFVKEVTSSGKVRVQFNGKNRSRMKDFMIGDVRWLAGLLTQLSDAQIRDMFRAANYSDSNIDLLTRAVKNRIDQLDRAASDRRFGGR